MHRCRPSGARAAGFVPGSPGHDLDLDRILRRIVRHSAPGPRGVPRPRLPASLAAAKGAAWRGTGCHSGLRKGGELALGLPIPAHAFDRMLPSALHLLQGILVRRVTRGDHVLEMLILRLDDVVCGRPLVGNITRATQLPTCHGCHGFHDLRLLSLSRLAAGRRCRPCACPAQDTTRTRTMSRVVSTLGSAISSTSRTRSASTWNTKATLVEPAWIQAAPSSPSIVTGTAPRAPLKRAATAAAPS